MKQQLFRREAPNRSFSTLRSPRHIIPWSPLYDLRDDLVQRRNLYLEKPDKVRHLKVLLEQYKSDGRSTPGARRAEAPVTGKSGMASIPDENL